MSKNLTQYLHHQMDKQAGLEHSQKRTADRLRAAGVPATKASHFLSQCLFCFFAEDVHLLPARL
ncbi:hypothetical protein, partial [Ferruginibacter sp.]